MDTQSRVNKANEIQAEIEKTVGQLLRLANEARELDPEGEVVLDKPNAPSVFPQPLTNLKVMPYIASVLERRVVGLLQDAARGLQYFIEDQAEWSLLAEFPEANPNEGLKGPYVSREDAEEIAEELMGKGALVVELYNHDGLVKSWGEPR